MLTCDLFTVANLLVFHSYNTVSTHFPGIGTIVVYWRVVEFLYVRTKCHDNMETLTFSLYSANSKLTVNLLKLATWS